MHDQRFVYRFDCPIEPSEVLVTCLQSVNFHLLDEMYFTFFVSLLALENFLFWVSNE